MPADVLHPPTQPKRAIPTAIAGPGQRAASRAVGARVKALQWLLLALGLAGFAWLVAGADLELLARQTRQLGAPGLAIVVALGGLDQLCHAFGWRSCFERAARPPLGELLAAHFAGNAVNLATPTAGVGGEFVRATLLPEGTRGEAAIASLAVDRLTLSVADGAIGAVGVVLLVVSPGIDAPLRAALVGGTGLVLVGIAIFAVLQRHGRLVEPLLRGGLVARVLGPDRARELRRAGGDIDRRIAALHAERPRSLVASTALHAAGSAMFIAQLACLVAFLDLDATPGALLRIFAVVTALDLLAVFVPARLGAQEGARMLGVSLAGLPPELGLLCSLAQRVEQAVWTGVGFAIYWRRLRAGAARVEARP